MKRFFFLVVSLVLFANVLFAQKNDREFGVVVFIHVDGTYAVSQSISINNIEVALLPPKNILYHKTYSEGNVLLSIRDLDIGSRIRIVNILLKNNDTIYIKLDSRNKYNPILTDKITIETEYKYYTKVYSSERINYTYIPESFDNSRGKRSGSGFLLSKEGYVVTNYHVIENTEKINVRGVNGNKKSSLSAKVIYTDTINDLALLQLEDKIIIESPVYKIRNTTSDVGESIYVLGYPLTTAMGEDIKLTDGLVSSQNGYKGDTASYQISAPVQPGNSGGPLFDKDGNVVGIVNAKLRGAESATYAIKVKYLLQAIEKAGIKLSVATSNSLAGKPLSQQVKATQDFVYIIDAE